MRQAGTKLYDASLCSECEGCRWLSMPQVGVWGPASISFANISAEKGILTILQAPEKRLKGLFTRIEKKRGFACQIKLRNVYKVSPGSLQAWLKGPGLLRVKGILRTNKRSPQREKYFSGGLGQILFYVGNNQACIDIITYSRACWLYHRDGIVWRQYISSLVKAVISFHGH